MLENLIAEQLLVYCDRGNGVTSRPPEMS